MEKIEKNEELGAEKPTKAIALKYDKENSVAPKVVAKGQGLIAENILNVCLNYLFIYICLSTCISFLCDESS